MLTLSRIIKRQRSITNKDELFRPGKVIGDFHLCFEIQIWSNTCKKYEYINKLINIIHYCA